MVVVSCTEGVSDPLIQLGPTRSINGSYALESLVVNDVQLDIDAGRPVTLNLNAVDRTDVTGTGPCNDFFGGWSPGDGKLTITEWVTTDFDCPTREAIAVESALFDALTQPIEANVDLDQTPARLVMTGDNTSIIWAETMPPRTQPTNPPPFEGTTTTIPAGSDPGEIDVSGRRVQDEI